MRLIAVTQRVFVDPKFGERRDSLDQRWWSYLNLCGLIPFPIPNHPETARKLIEIVPLEGVLLTGGGDLKEHGGNTPERDETEKLLLEDARKRKKPLMGICRGMQLIQNYFGTPLRKVEGHICKSLAIRVDHGLRLTNSYHNWGTDHSIPPLLTWAEASDGVVKGVRHNKEPIMGIMWHPERTDPFDAEDVALFREFYRST